MISRNRRVVLTLVLSVAAVGCDKVPLLAPTESTITLSTASTTVQANGSTTLTATVLEKSGTAVQNGTLVTFTTTVGRISPSEARTKNGQVDVTFSGNGQSGEAEIRANSGGATTKDPLKIKVGGAAVARIQLTASPGSVSSGGGSSQITAIVTDANGNPLTSIAVNFSTDAGTLSNSTVSTDSNGQVRTTLTTSRDATVTATTGAGSTGSGVTGTVKVTVLSQPTVSITSSSAPSAGSATTFTVTANPAANSGAVIQDVRVDFGDGSSVALGATTGSVSVQHVYQSSGTFTATVTARDSNGGTASASTVVVVAAQQPLAVNLATTQSTSGVNTTVNFTATVTPAGTPVASYAWNFGDLTSAVTSGNQTNHVYTAGSGAKTVTLTVTSTSGQTGSTTTSVVP